MVAEKTHFRMVSYNFNKRACMTKSNDMKCFFLFLQGQVQRISIKNPSLILISNGGHSGTEVLPLSVFIGMQ